MRQRLTVILTFVVIIGLLVVINTISHVQQEPEHDLEFAPNRSTYHSGPTGTRALHDFLNESGYRVMRWREPVAQLMSRSGRMVTTLVVVGETRLPFEQEDINTLHGWVATGGRLVIIDRTPDRRLLPDLGWSLQVLDGALPNLDTNPADVSQMTQNVTEVKPIQPTLFTSNVESVMPSRFASRFVVKAEPTPTPTRVVGFGNGPVDQRPSDVFDVPSPAPTPEDEDLLGTFEEEEQTAPPPVEASSPPVAIADDNEDADDEEENYDVSIAPVMHIGDSSGALLVDFAYGGGRIILLSDPYLIANGGIRLKDNLTLATNLMGGPSTTRLIAFDEYHQGRGISRNAFASYFAGTAVLPIAGQLVLLVLVVLWSNGRRFARPLPLAQVDRRSSLEFVASMAELQERSRAYDLAIENIYTRLRRVLARHAGVGYNSSRSEIAQRIAERSTIDRHELETLMRHCEEAINGEPITSRQSVHLVRRLREIERDLGLRMRSREARQAAENI
ncbi:MAG TPA: DUF4350 domain-containing protein [Pyrinomonadaceae bacterium]|nr:DUF4350 domain-containing protein [Pyrinomonadaceae bacterium]